MQVFASGKRRLHNNIKGIFVDGQEIKISLYADDTALILDWSISYFRLVNQLWFIVPVNPWKNRASSELLYKSNRLQVSMVYRLINHLGCW